MDPHNYVSDYVIIETCGDVGVPEGPRKEGDELLIDLVRSRPYIYDKQEKNYRDAQMKENAWSKIARVLESSPSECQSRFLRLRQSFSKGRQMRESESRSGAGKSKRPKWSLYDSMQFLNQHVLQRRGFTNVAASTTSAASPQPEQSTSKHTAPDSQDEEEDQGRVCNTPLEVHDASSDATESTLGTMADRICAGEARPSEEHDPDVLIGKLVTAELKKATGPRKQKLKNDFMQILYGSND